MINKKNLTDMLEYLDFIKKGNSYVKYYGILMIPFSSKVDVYRVWSAEEMWHSFLLQA